MNQIYACREGRKVPFTDAKISSATTTPTRSVSRSVFSKLLLGVFLFLVAGAISVSAQTRVYNGAAGTQSFVVPPGVTSLNIDITGAGGGGSGASTVFGEAGSGGGGGAFERLLGVAVTPGQTLTLTVPLGGAGGAVLTAGTAGATTTIAPLGIAVNGGGGGALGTPGAGGAGGTQPGAAGGRGEGFIPIIGSGGGGGGGAGAFAVASTAGNIGVGGLGGAGGTTGGGPGGNAGNPGVVALAPGGGGGGGSIDGGGVNFAGAAGGAAIVIISYTCPTYTLPAFGPFCQNDAALPITGNGVAPGGTSALVGLSPLFVANIGPTLSGTNVTGTLATGFSFNPTTAGEITVTYSYTDPNPLAPACVTTTTRDVVVFPTSPVLAVPANTCATGITVTAAAAIPGFTQQFSFDNGTTWGVSNVGPTTPGCYTITSRWVKNGAFGNVANGAVSPCPNSAAVQAVVFPATPTMANAANTCNAALTLPTIPTVAGFNSRYQITPPGGAAGAWVDAATAQTQLTTTPGCWTISGRYELAAACGGTGAGATSGVAGCTPITRNGVVFPATPTLANAANTCNAALVLPTIANVNGFNSTYQITAPNGGVPSAWVNAATAQALLLNTPGCWTIGARYELAAACGTAAAINATGTGLCGPATSNGVVFPATPALTTPANTCNAALTLTAIATVPGFNSTYQITAPNGGVPSAWVNAAAAQALLLNTPGCWTIGARYELAAACGTAAAAGATSAVAGCTPATTNAVVFPQPVMNVITPTCTPTGFTPTMPVVAGFNQQFSNDGGATWYAGASPVSASGCYTVIGRYSLIAACGATPAGANGPCANSAPANVLIYPVAPVISSPATTCAPTQFVLPSVPNQAPDFTTQWSIVPTGNAPNWLFLPTIPSTPGIYDVQARYVNSAICGTIAANTPSGLPCSITNIVTATINTTPVVTILPNVAPVCCNTTIGGFNLSVSNGPMLPAGGTLVINWTNNNPAIGLAAFGTGNIPAFTAACNPTTQFATISVTASYTFAGQTCTSAPMNFTITVNANVTGTINGPNLSICTGQTADINVNLVGSPNFSGNLTVSVIGGVGLATANLAFGPSAPVGGGAGPLPAVTVSGPSAITIPANFLTNGSSNTTVYRVSWFSTTSLKDANGCQPTVGAPLTGFQDVTVYPVPTITPTLVNVGDVCPGTNIVFNVANPNLIPGSVFNWVAKDALGNTLGFANNVAFGNGAVTNNLGLSCPIAHTNPITFSFTAVGPGPLGCTSPVSTVDVNVRDITPPVFTANPLLNVTLDRCDAAGIAAALAFIPTATNTNCGGAPVVTVGADVFTPTCSSVGPTYAPGKTGTITALFTATEPCGAVATITQTINIVDNTVPTWTTAVGSLNTTVICDLGTGGTFTNRLNTALGLVGTTFIPVATDQCANPDFPNALVTNRQRFQGAFAQTTPGTCVVSGTYTVTYTTKDMCNNTSVAFTVVVTVIDNVPPTLNSPAAQTLDVGAGANCQVPLPDYTGLITPNDCSAVTLTQSPAVGTIVVGGVGAGPVGGTQIVTITATDACGNVSTRDITVNLTDNTPPIARCHPITVALSSAIGAGTVSVIPSQIDGNGAGPTFNPKSSDNCGLGPVNAGITFAGGSFPVGNTPTNRTYTCNNLGVNNITLVATDNNGNTASCNTTITVVDNTAPVITCAPPVTYFKNATCVTIMPNMIGVGQTTAVDNAVGPVGCGVITITQNPAAGSIIAADVATLGVVFVATDPSGNSSTCTTTVSFRDNTPPVLVGCPTSFTVTTGVGNTDCQVFVPWTPPTVTDNCSPILGNTTLTSTHQPNVPNTIQSPNGGGIPAIPDNSAVSTLVTLNVSGIPAGSTVQSVTINGINHTFPSDLDIALTSPLNTTVILMSDIGSSIDMTGETITLRDGFPALSTGGLNPTGTYAPTNSGTPDNFPAPSTLGSLTQATPLLSNFGNGNMNGTWTLTVVDDLGGDLGSINNWGITFFNPSSSNGTPFFVGVTPVTYTATDAAGNTASCTFTVTVVDNTLPTVTCTTPGDKTVSATSVGCTYTHAGAAWDATGSDNCIPVLSTFYRLTGATGGAFPGIVGTNGQSLNGRVFNLGTTTVTWTVVDQSTNSTTCSFNVIVVDNVAPVITCPATVNVNTNAAGCKALVLAALTTPVVSDACGVVLTEWSVSGATPISSGIGNLGNYTFNVGTSLVTYRVSDAAGNSTLCSFNVVVTNAVAGAISGTATVAQNIATTSTVTFTGSGGAANYTFTYNINGGPTQTVSTTGGSNVVTVAQSNALLGTFVYNLLSVTDANGCPGSLTAPTSATITVVNGTPDLTNSQFFTTTQIAPGGTIDEVIGIRNVGTAATSAPIVFTVTNYAAITGLSAASLVAPTVTIGFTTYTLTNSSWTITSTPSALTFTSNAGFFINPGATAFVGVRITRAAGANGTVTHSSTITGGTGGGETPVNNNSISNTLLKN